jgi:hypothetical protein
VDLDHDRLEALHFTLVARPDDRVQQFLQHPR